MHIKKFKKIIFKFPRPNKHVELEQIFKGLEHSKTNSKI